MKDGMKEFSVHGPFKVPLEPKKIGKMIALDLTQFWAGLGDLAARKGVYVFAVRAGKGYTPIYVGKTGRQSFYWEAFGNYQRANHYNPALLEYRKGNPVIFLVTHPVTKGAVNKSLIDQLETFLIDVASSKNPDLSNIRKKPDHGWRIRGVVRGKKGEATGATASFARAVGLV